MKIRNTVLISAFLVTIGMSSVHAQQNTSSEIEQKLEARIVSLEKRVAALEAQLAALSLRSASTTQPALVGTVQADANSSPLVMDDWDFTSGQNEFGQPYYQITLILRNTGKKAIKLLDASVQFSDLLDAHLYGIKVSPDIHIAAGQTHIDQGQYDVNQFINEQTRMRSMKKSDIKATLVLRKIVFEDNTVLNLSQ